MSSGMARTAYGCEYCDNERFPKVSIEEPPDGMRLSCDECGKTTHHLLILKIGERNNHPLDTDTEQ